MLTDLVAVQYVLIRMHIIRMKKIRMAILNHVSTVLKPGRATLVLGPPGGGKSSLLKAMAGKLSHHNLQVGAPPSLLFNACLAFGQQAACALISLSLQSCAAVFFLRLDSRMCVL